MSVHVIISNLFSGQWFCMRDDMIACRQAVVIIIFYYVIMHDRRDNRCANLSRPSRPAFIA